MEKINQRFLERHKKILEDDFENFLDFIKKESPRRYIRTNTLKIDPKDLKKRLEDKGWRLKEISWYPIAFEVLEKEETPIGSTLEYSLGYYYPQDKSSMIPPLVLDPKPGEVILDLCAAPGSKTTQMAQHMENRGVILANDIDLERIKALASNVQRMGCINVIITRNDGRKFKKVGEMFDKVLVDAPCTGTGTLIWDLSITNRWSPKLSLNFSRLQFSLLSAGFSCLKPGGALVYSTCSLEPEENEAVISDFLKTFENAKIEKIKIKGIKHIKGILEWEKNSFDEEVKKCWRIYPHFNNSEGFFISKIRKL